MDFLGGLDVNEPITLNGVNDGVFARLVGFNGNHELSIAYSPNPYMEFINKPMDNIPSLYQYQLKKRLKSN